MSDDHFLFSSFQEKTLEHVFVGEVLRRLWVRGVRDAEVLRADVDGAGYDVVIEAGGVVRHIQLKSSFKGARTSGQKINRKLADKPAGCVVWIYFAAETLELGPFGWFGGASNEALPTISGFKNAKHTKADAQGKKAIRPDIFVVPRGSFTRLPAIDELVGRLFGLS